MTRPASAPSVAVIVLHYGPVDDTLECLASLARLKDDFETIVVVNGEPGEASDTLRRRFPGVRLLHTGGNLGYAGGNNVGLRATSAELVVLLNNDTVVDDAWLRELVAAAQDAPRAGALQSTALLHGTLDRVNTRGNRLHYAGVGWTGGLGERHRGEGAAFPVAFASGVSLLLRREALEDVGLLEESLVSYHEDTDLCLRMRLRGWDVLAVPRSVLWHKYSLRKSARKMYYLERNRPRIVLTFYTLRSLVLLSPALLLVELATWIAYVKEGYASAKARSLADLLRDLPAIRARRREVQARRTVPDSAWTRLLDADIDHPELDSFLVRRALNPVLRAFWRFAGPAIR